MEEMDSDDTTDSDDSIFEDGITRVEGHVDEENTPFMDVDKEKKRKKKIQNAGKQAKSRPNSTAGSEAEEDLKHIPMVCVDDNNNGSEVENVETADVSGSAQDIDNVTHFRPASVQQKQVREAIEAVVNDVTTTKEEPVSKEHLIEAPVESADPVSTEQSNVAVITSDVLEPGVIVPKMSESLQSGDGITIIADVFVSNDQIIEAPLESTELGNNVSVNLPRVPSGALVDEFSIHRDSNIIIPSTSLNNDQLNEEPMESTELGNDVSVNPPRAPSGALVDELSESNNIVPSTPVNEAVLSSANQPQGVPEGRKHGIIILELLNESRKLINDKATIRNLIENSPFGPKYSGYPKLNDIRKCEIKLYINDKKHLNDLVQITSLRERDRFWPIKCRIPPENPGLNYGVMKNIHPEVELFRIKDELLRSGVDVEEVHRIRNHIGITYCVKILFKNNIIPESVLYAGEEKRIHKFNPPIRSLICFKCSGPGHIAIHCSSRERCPKCSKNHHKFQCTADTINNPALRKCANCGGNHTATYGKCKTVREERQIMKIRVNQDVPRYHAKNIWKERAEERQRQAQINANNAASAAAENNAPVNHHSGVRGIPWDIPDRSMPRLPNALSAQTTMNPVPNISSQENAQAFNHNVMQISSQNATQAPNQIAMQTSSHNLAQAPSPVIMQTSNPSSSRFF